MQVNLYADGGAAGSALTPVPDGVIDDLNGDGQVTLADVDNYPFQWAPQHNGEPGWTGTPGPEDVDRNGNGVFDAGDAIAIVIERQLGRQPADRLPRRSRRPVLPGRQVLRRPAQLQPGAAGGLRRRLCLHHVRARRHCLRRRRGDPAGRHLHRRGGASRPNGYKIVKEEDKNVDFGDSYTPSLQLLPPVCVGDAHTVPQYLSLFPAGRSTGGVTAGQTAARSATASR